MGDKEDRAKETRSRPGITPADPTSTPMIPQVIHYCWFGGKPLPRSARKYIASWRRFFPGYEIREWNETNYNVRAIPYTAAAYDAGKFAFVSDYARFDILYREGGVYFDTDVEVIAPFDDILARGAFMGCERDGSAPAPAPGGGARGGNSDGNTGSVSLETEGICGGRESATANPGLGIATAPGLGIYKEILEKYRASVYHPGDAGLVVPYATQVLRAHGLRDVAGIQQVEEITVYPSDYFNPLDSATGALHKTANTRSIHHYTASWLPRSARLRVKMARPFHRVFGEDCFSFLKRGGGK